MFSTIEKFFHNHHFISIDCNYTIPSYQISTPTTTSLQNLKSVFLSKKLFLLLHIKFYEKPVSLINKPQPLSHQSMSNITPPLPHHPSQPTPRIWYTTLLHYLHIPKSTRKKLHTYLVHWRPNKRSHSVLL